MSVDIKNSIDKNILEMVKGQKKVIDDAIKEGAKLIKRGLEEEAPKNTFINEEHIRDNVKISKIDDDGTITIGFNKNVSWRVHFTELGTIHQRPNNFIERTEKSLQNEVMDLIQRELKKGLGL
jgi:HK97 gp10 family phage protein